MTDNVNITQQVNKVTISSPGPQGPGGSVFLALTASVGWAFSASNAINSASSNISASSRFSSSVINGLITTSSITNTFINVASVQPTQEGSIFYDPAVHHSLNLVTDTATPQELGQQVLARVINGTADNTTLTKGTIVYVSGATGNRVRVDRAIANDVNKHDVLGMVYDDIANNAEGFVLTFGVIDDINTGGYTAADTLYLSATNAGQYTNVAPSYPNYKYELGTVARANTNNGRILFNPNPAYNSNTASGNILLSDGYRAVGSTNAILDLLGNLRVATASVAGDTRIGGNLNVAGNFFVQGVTASISASNIVLNDPLLYLADGNPANINDIGIIGSFTPGASATYQHTGLVRDASDNTWKLFSGVVAEPTNTVDFTSASYDTLQLGTINSISGTSSFFNIYAASQILNVGKTVIGGTTQLAPTSGASTAMLSITATSSLNPGIVVRAAANQSAPLQEWQNSAGASVIRITSVGALNSAIYRDLSNGGPYFSMTSTRTNIQLAAPTHVFQVSGYSNSSASTYSQTADIQQWVWSNGFTTYPLSTVNASGQFTIGGSVGLISSSLAMLSVIGTSSLTTPAIIAQGGSAVNIQEWWINGGTSATSVIDRFGRLALGSSTSPGGVLHVRSLGATGQIIQTRNATNQTANIFEMLDSNAISILSAINASGQFVIGGSVSMFASANAPTVSSAAMLSVYKTSSINAGIIVRSASPEGTSHFEIQRADGVPIFAIDSGNRLWWNDNFSGPNMRWGQNTVLSTGTSPNTLVFTPYAASRFAMTFRGLSGQTGDLLQFQDSNASALAVFTKDANIVLGSFGGSTTPILSTGYNGSAYLTIYQNASANAGIVIRRNNSNSNARAFEVQDQVGNIVAQIDPFGGAAFRMGNASGDGATSTTLSIGKANPTFRNLVLVSPSASTGSAVIEIQGTTSGFASPVFAISALGQISSGSGYGAIATSSAMIGVFNRFPTGQGIIVRGAPSQSANLQEWQDSTGTISGSINAYGALSTASSINSPSIIGTLYGLSSSAVISSSALISNDSASLGGIIGSSYALQSYVNTASTNVLSQAQSYANSASLNAYSQAITYANSASLSAYNAASAFTQNSSAGLYNFIVSASQGIITAGSVQWSTSAGNSIRSSSALYAASLVGPHYGTGSFITNNTIAPAALTSSAVTIGTSTIGLGTTLATLPVTALSSSIITLGTTQLNLGGTFGNLDRVVIGNNTASTASFTAVNLGSTIATGSVQWSSSTTISASTNALSTTASVYYANTIPTQGNNTYGVGGVIYTSNPTPSSARWSLPLSVTNVVTNYPGIGSTTITASWNQHSAAVASNNYYIGNTGVVALSTGDWFAFFGGKDSAGNLLSTYQIGGSISGGTANVQSNGTRSTASIIIPTVPSETWSSGGNIIVIQKPSDPTYISAYGVNYRVGDANTTNGGVFWLINHNIGRIASTNLLSINGVGLNSTPGIQIRAIGNNYSLISHPALTTSGTGAAAAASAFATASNQYIGIVTG